MLADRYATLAAERPLQNVEAPAWFNPEPFFDRNRIVRPPEWIAWSLLASGAITLLYSSVGLTVTSVE